ncbi:MAG TPA: hypothetical protein VFO65_00765 [Acidimicrobiales bacterium]|nr:hypothetical protein [Acidimicrobiales bacterium]
MASARRSRTRCSRPAPIRPRRATLVSSHSTAATETTSETSPRSSAFSISSGRSTTAARSTSARIGVVTGMPCRWTVGSGSIVV